MNKVAEKSQRNFDEVNNGVVVRLKFDSRTEIVHVNEEDGVVEMTLNVRPMHLDWDSIRRQMIEQGATPRQADMRTDVAAEAVFVESFKDVLADRLVR